MTVMAVGAGRVKVRRWLSEDPYPKADVEEIADLEWDSGLTDLLAATEQKVREALTVSPSATWSEDVELADDPVAACWQLAAITPVGPLDQLSLLGCATTKELLERTDVLAQEAIEAAQW